MIKKYCKKPIIIEAVQLTEDNILECIEFIGMKHLSKKFAKKDDGLLIKTLEGIIKASFGDYIIKGAKGEFYPCKPDIFKITYDEVKSEE